MDTVDMSSGLSTQHVPGYPTSGSSPWGLRGCWGSRPSEGAMPTHLREETGGIGMSFDALSTHMC